MNNAIKFISGAVIILGTIQQLSIQTKVTADAAAKGVTVMVGEEDPIIVRGHVRNQSGTAIANASVKLKKNGVVVKQTTTNTSGQYIMGGVAADTYVLHLSADGYVTKTIDLAVSQEVVRIDTLIAQ